MDLGSGPGESNHLLPGRSFGARSPLSEFVATSRRLSHNYRSAAVWKRVSTKVSTTAKVAQVRSN
jgi:hypothetical protein